MKWPLGEDDDLPTARSHCRRASNGQSNGEMHQFLQQILNEFRAMKKQQMLLMARQDMVCVHVNCFTIFS